MVDSTNINEPKIPLVEHIIAYVTLGLLCGWYYFLLILYPLLLYFSYKGSYIALSIFVSFLVLTVYPLKYYPYEPFMYCYLFKIWRDYFGITFDKSLTGDINDGQRYMFFEFPHGIFPMGQFLSCSLIKDVYPGQMICGTGADVIFTIPVMRQIMAWIGTLPAKRSNITKILNRGHHCAVIPGGIAEMYLMNSKTEEVYLKTRRNTVKAAIQEGATIIPIFFFGNTRLFTVVGSDSTNTWLQRLSRKLRASVVFFYGRNYLPVPYRQHIHMASGPKVTVKQNANPTTEEIDEVMDRVIKSLNLLYEKQKPSWEDRPLVIK